MKSAIRIARLERVAAQAKPVGCASCAGTNLATRRGVIREVVLLSDDDGVHHFVHCIGCARGYHGRIAERTNDGVVFEDLVSSEFPV